MGYLLMAFLVCFLLISFMLLGFLLWYRHNPLVCKDNFGQWFAVICILLGNMGLELGHFLVIWYLKSTFSTFDNSYAIGWLCHKELNSTQGLRLPYLSPLNSLAPCRRAHWSWTPWGQSKASLAWGRRNGPRHQSSWSPHQHPRHLDCRYRWSLACLQFWRLHNTRELHLRLVYG